MYTPGIKDSVIPIMHGDDDKDVEALCFILDFFFLHVRVDLVEFTDEEGYGKYLDLHEVYDKFLNLRGVEVGFEFDDTYSTHLSCYTCRLKINN